MIPDADYPALCELITTKEGLEGVLGRPGPRVLAKVVNALDDMCLAFIARSPFVIVASHDAEGRVDVSPKGDPAGFAHVLDHRTIAIPERPGNLRADTFRNVLQQPRVGLIFLVPGKGETLRVSGTARIARDGWLRERLAVAGRVPELVLVVTVEEAFMHCTKCMARSQVWQPQSWRPEGLASIGEAMVVHGNLDISVSEMRALAENDERERLY
jgi:PPOX class probable FMN-dependent enzyme